MVSPDFLKELDRASPGTWIGQPKLDGWRRVADNLSGWKFQAKHTKGPASKPLPKDLQEEFESLPWPKGIILDMEWLGPRVVAHVKENSLNIFDCLGWDGEWKGNVPFKVRYSTLEKIAYKPDPCYISSCKHINIVPCWSNPGLFDRYLEQMQNPLSEGLVIRRADSGLIGSFNHCANNPLWFKVKYRQIGEKGK